jgi:aminoglycoside phosphotransferase family enzyme
MANRRDETEQGGAAIPLGVKVAFLSAPGTYPDVAAVETRETHMAWVFLAGDRAYKLKKPVRYPFLDYSTPEARHRICVEEVRLNRRLGPDVYLGVSRLTVERDGRLAIDGAGRLVDWLVVMRRLPEALMLDAAIAAGTAAPGRIAAVAERLASFYGALDPVAVDPEAHVARFAHELAENRRVFDLKAFDSAGDRGTRISARLEALLVDDAQLIADRIAARRIVEGHGDLRPEHICLCDPPVVIDCLEFSRDLRLVDPFDELAFLAMECAVLGAPWIGPVLVKTCAERLGDRPSDRLLGFYTAYRGSFRARQALAHLLEPVPRTPGTWLPLASRYLDQAEDAALRLDLPAARPASRPRGGAG